MSAKNSGRSTSARSSPTLNTSPRLSITSLGAHNKSAHRQPRHVFTHTWVETVKRESKSNFHREGSVYSLAPDIIITNSDELREPERSASVPLQYIENQASSEPKTKSKKLTRSKRRNDDVPLQLSPQPSGSGAAHKGKRPVTHRQIPQILTQMEERPPSPTREEKLDYSAYKFTQVARMAKKWKQRTLHMSEEEIAMSSQEAQLNKQRKRPFVEIPQSMRLELLEEAHQIVTKTLEKYRSELGLRHKLTQITEEKCKFLAQELKK